jgi:F-type H+-transporting ATPase subunit delta
VPTGKLQAKRYSQAIFEIAKEKNTLNKWSEDLSRIVSLSQNPEFVAVIDNPRFSFDDKFKLVSNQLKSSDPLVLNMVKLLISRGNFGLVSEIYSEYNGLLDSYHGMEKAEVTTAVELEDKEKVALVERLESLTGKKINLTVKVDPTIIGGIIVRIGGKLIDGSSSSQLSALNSEMADARR